VAYLHDTYATGAVVQVSWAHLLPRHLQESCYSTKGATAQHGTIPGIGIGARGKED
jgi:hypothetical protein